MGRYSVPLAVQFVDFAGVGRADRVLDVGSGPGALTGELVRRVGAAQVVAVDPAVAFVKAIRQRHGGVEAHCATAEELPVGDDSFDVVLAQLVVHFMTDPVGGLREMARASTHVVAACVWDYDEGGSPLSHFWSVACELDPDAPGEQTRAGTRRGHLTTLFNEAGLDDVEETSLRVEVTHDSFDDWWEPFELGVGPAGAYVAVLSADHRDRLRQRFRNVMSPPFIVTGVAWAARGRVKP